MDPDNPTIHNNLGIEYLSIGDKASALAEYEALKKLDPEGAERLRRRIEAGPQATQEE
jgi:hypothetical protein